MVKTTVQIEGMACNMCEAHIQQAIRNNFDIKSVKASFRKNNAEIISQQPLDKEQLKKVIDDTGYRFLNCSSVPYEKKGLFGLFG